MEPPYKIKTHKSRSALSLSLSLYRFKTQARACAFRACFQHAWPLLQNHNPTSEGEILGAVSRIFAKPGFDFVENLKTNVSTKCPLL